MEGQYQGRWETIPGAQKRRTVPRYIQEGHKKEASEVMSD